MSYVVFDRKLRQATDHVVFIDARHGTLASYTYDKCRCRDCRKAMAEYQRKRRDKTRNGKKP